MNAAISSDAVADIDEADAESRRFLSETVVNGTAHPWDIGQAGQQVSPNTYTLTACTTIHAWAARSHIAL